MNLKSKNNFKKVLIYGGIFLLYFFCFFVYRNLNIFIDESDNLVGGMIIANGGVIYKDFISQHTPLMYYLCSIFTLLGANSISQYRLFLYGFMSIIFLMMFIRYNKKFGQITMFLFPLFYIATMANFGDVGHMVLSEQIQSVSIVVLLLEFLMFLDSKELYNDNYIAISIAIFCSTSVAFISVFSVFSLLLGIVMIVIFGVYENNDKNLFKISLWLIRKYWKGVFIIIFPFIGLVLYFIGNGNLRNFYEQAYLLNRVVYPNYSDFGNSILPTIFSTIDNFFIVFSSHFSALFTTPETSLRILLNSLINIFFVTFVFKKDKFGGIILIIFILANTTRGSLGFHSMPYWMTTILMGLILIHEELNVKRKFSNVKITYGQKIFGYIIILIIFSPYMKSFSNIVPTREDFQFVDYGQDSYEYYINKLVPSNETFYTTSLMTHLYVNTNRLPASKVYNVVPWFTDLYLEDILFDLENNQPKMIIHNSTYGVWGYEIHGYAPILDEYITNNYSILDVSIPDIWILNSYYDKALNILSIEFPFFSTENEELTVIGPITDEREVKQIFISSKSKINKITVRIGTYTRVNYSQLKMELIDLNDNSVLFSNNIDVQNLVDNEYLTVELPNVETTIGEKYAVAFSANSTNENDFVTIYRTVNNGQTEGEYAIIDGEIQSFNLNINIYGD